MLGPYQPEDPLRANGEYAWLNHPGSSKPAS